MAAVEPPNSILGAKAVMTSVDESIARLTIARLKRRPPFQPEGEEVDFRPTNVVEEAAFAYAAEKRISWGEAHLAVATAYRYEGDFRGALEESRAIDKVEGGNPAIRGLMGDVLIELGEFATAESLLIEALSSHEDPYGHYRLGVLYLEAGDPTGAVEQIERSLAIIEAAGLHLDPAHPASGDPPSPEPSASGASSTHGGDYTIGPPGHEPDRRMIGKRPRSPS